MNKSKLLWALLVIGAVGSATALSTSGFRKLNEAKTFDAEKVRMNRISDKRYASPATSAPSFVMRTSENEAPTLRGLVINSNTPYICEFKGENGFTVSNIFSDYDMPDGSGSAFYADGKYYIMSLDQPYFGAYETNMAIYDAESWNLLEERNGLLPSSAAYCVTYDPITGAAYGYFLNDDMDSTWQMFGRMNLATGEVLGLNNVDDTEGFLCIANATDGYLYGVNVNGMYCRITKKGEITKLGHTDIKPRYVQSAAIDPATGKFYWAGFTDEGEGGLYVVDPVNYMATLIQRFPNNQEIIGLYVVENKNDADMPSEVLDLNSDFYQDTLNGTVSFTAPDHYGNGNILTGTLTGHVSIDGNHYEKSIMPGESATFDVSVKYSGLYNAAAWVTVDGVDCNKKYVQRWVGPDYPCGVTNLTPTVDGTSIILTWDAPTEGQHGGYVNPDEVTYVINRDGYGTKYLRDYSECSLEDDLGENVSADVRYSVLSTYQDLRGITVYSDWVHVGNEVLEVPFSLSPSGEFNKFLVVDANEDDNTWEAYIGGFATYYGGDSQADDWMITPYISLTSGTIYQIDYSASAKMGLFSPEIIEVMIGQGDTPENLTQTVDSQTIQTVGITKFNSYSATFSVPETGLYRIGFHVISDTGQQIGLSSIYLSQLAASSGPAAPTSLSVEPAPLGELKATVIATLPLKDSDGNDLTSISRVELYNAGRLADTVYGVTPGEECELTDNEATQGNNRFSVVAYGPDGTKGLSAEVSGWIGIDIPSTPTDFTISEIENGVHLSWLLPETGLHGGYVDPAEVLYMIVDPVYGSEYGMVKGVNETNLMFDELTYQATLSLGLRVMNIAGSNSEGAVSKTIMVGPAYELPFHEHFARYTDYSWIIMGNTEDEVMGWAPEEATMGKDGLPGVSSYYGEMSYDSQKLASGKIYIPEESDATLRMWLMGRAHGQNGGSFSILLSEVFGSDYHPIFTKSFVNGSDTSWQPIEVSLAEYAGKNIYLALEGLPASEDGGIVIGIDNLTIRESMDYDGQFTNLTIDTDEVEVGKSNATIEAWISNQGQKPMTAGSYNIDFYAGSRRFASVPGVEMEASFGFSNYSVTFIPDTDDSDPTTIYAKIAFDQDMDMSNNKSKNLSVYVVCPELPSAENLTAESTQEGVRLEWTAADQNGKPIRTVTDDFESYHTFDNNRAGKWTMIDEDQSEGIVVSYFFPGSAGALGWVVMEPGAIPTLEGETLASRLPAYSGEKYMVAYRPGSGDNKDWLITPLLSGNAQEISFMARAESFNMGREMFEVYYSTTGTEISDFISLDNLSHRTEPEGWSEFRFAVPEGAKYFAVRCVSHNRCAMHIDDFTYESAATPVDATFIGYNVYRNGSLLNDVPTTAVTFLDNNPEEGNNTYVIRAVYDRGEAPASNSATLSFSGISSIYYNVDAMSQPVYDLKGNRVYNLEDGEIYVTKGKRFLYQNKGK